MDSGINEGILNTIAVQAESTYGGSGTGTARYLPGKISFNHQPQHLGTTQRTNVWREMDGDSYAARLFEGTFEVNYCHGETMALILSSLLKRSGSSPNYTFAAHHLSSRQSLAIALSYLPNAKHFVFRGVIIESAQFTIRAREQVRVRFAFKAAKLTTDGPLSSPVTETELKATGLQAAVDYGGANNPRAYDGSFQIINRVELVNFDETGVAQAYVPQGRVTFSGDIGEWMSNDSTEGDAIAANVRGMVEDSAVFSLVPASGKLLELDISRMLTRSGTPPGLQSGGIGYRAGIEAQTGEDRSDKPVLTMTL